jgi:hypothetical protein
VVASAGSAGASLRTHDIFDGATIAAPGANSLYFHALIIGDEFQTRYIFTLPYSGARGLASVLICGATSSGSVRQSSDSQESRRPNL